VDPVALHIHERVSTQAILRMAAREDVNRSFFADPEQEYNEAAQFYKHDVHWSSSGIGREPVSLRASSEGESEGGKESMTYEEKMAQLRERAKKESADAARLRKQAKIQAAKAENRVLFSYQGVAAPSNKKRQSVPTIVTIARYWSERDTFRLAEWHYPGCFACGDWSQREYESTEFEWRQSGLERCHLIN
jgi:hypothetical protein